MLSSQPSKHKIIDISELSESFHYVTKRNIIIRCREHSDLCCIPQVVLHLWTHSFEMVRKRELGLSQGPVVSIYTIIKLGGILNSQESGKTSRSGTAAYFEFDFQHSRAFKARVLIL